MVGRRSWHYQIDDLPQEKWFAQQQTKLYKPSKKGSNQRIIFWFTKWHFMLVFQHSGLQKKSTELGKNAIVLSRRWSRYNLWCWSTALAGAMAGGIISASHLLFALVFYDSNIWRASASFLSWGVLKYGILISCRVLHNTHGDLVKIKRFFRGMCHMVWKMVKFVGGLICCIFN